MRKTLRVLLSLLTVAFFFSCSLATKGSEQATTVKSDARAATEIFNRPAVPEPPKTKAGEVIPISQVPMFVTFGYDDNGYSDGMNWAVDVMKGRKNPTGVGNVKTFDGTDTTVSFYNCTYYSSNWISESPTYVKRAWRAAYDAGHEIGNHTTTHGHGSAYSVSQWDTQIDGATAAMGLPFDPNEPNSSPSASNGIGLNASEIYGFRTPYLEYNDNLFQSLKNKNMYDCSIEEGFQYLQDGTNYVWPYTLDNGSPGHDVQVEWGSKQPIQPQPGMWEMPVYTLIVPPELRETMKSRQSWFDIGSGKITGFDYNLWVSFSMTKAEFLATLKHTLDLRLQGNRAPFMLGAHTDYYSTKYSTPAASVAERRAALKEFLDYAQTKSAVRIVSVNRILEWVKDPAPMGTLIKHTVTPSADLNGTIAPATAFEVSEGESATFTLDPDKGYMVDQVLVNGVPADVNGNSVTVGYIDAPTTVKASFKAIPAGEPFQATYYWTYNPADEPVDMTTPMVNMLDMAGATIATVPEALAKRIAMEGSGFLPDGRLLNLANEFGWPESRFLEVDQATAPWGFDAQGQALVPWRSLATDPEVIPAGSDVYIKEFDGITVPGGMVHDGWFKAVDTSHSFSGFQIDIFAATYPNYHAVNQLLNEISVMEIVAPMNPVDFKTITASSDNLGTIWPTGQVRVVVGKGEKFYFFPNTDHVVDQVLVNGQPVPFDSVENSCMMENVTVDSTIKATFKPKGTVSQYSITTSVTNGTITPSFTVTEGGNATIEFAPTPSTFKLEKVLINGKVEPVSGNSYTFAKVTANQTIEVFFADNVIPPTELTAEYTIGTDWGTGFGANVVVTNNSTAPVSSWKVIMTFSGNQTVSGWSGTFSQVGNVVTVTNTNWNGTIPAGGSVSFGMNGSYSGTNEIPSITVE